MKLFKKAPDAPEISFDNDLTMREYAAMIAFIPIHTAALPALIAILCGKTLSMASVNFTVYVISALCMLFVGWRMLRRDFDALCEHPIKILIEIVAAYFAMIAMNILVGMVFSALSPLKNPNNSAVVDLFSVDYGKTAAATVFLAPIAEELMFRAGVFGLVRRFSRAGAYVCAVLLFSLYHVCGYLVVDIRYIIYIVQYIPVSFLLCLVYERTRTIWGSIFFHMTVNAIGLTALQELQSLM